MLAGKESPPIDLASPHLHTLHINWNTIDMGWSFRPHQRNISDGTQCRARPAIKDNYDVSNMALNKVGDSVYHLAGNLLDNV